MISYNIGTDHVPTVVKSDDNRRSMIFYNTGKDYVPAVVIV